MIGPKLEYAVVVWSLDKKTHVKKLEKIQRNSNQDGTVPQLENYQWRKVEEMQLLTLKEKERDDIILLYKVVYDLQKEVML